MLKDYLVQEDLKRFHPAVENLLRQGEADFSKQKEAAEDQVYNDFNNKGYNTRLLRPKLILATDESKEDRGNRRRAVVNITVLSPGSVINILGSNTDEEDSFVIAHSHSINVDGIVSFLLANEYKYYKYEIIGGSFIEYLFLVESGYDNLYGYYWLHLIYQDQVTRTEDNNDRLQADYLSKYNKAFQKFVPWYDSNESGDIDIQDNRIKTNILKYTR